MLTVPDPNALHKVGRILLIIAANANVATSNISISTKIAVRQISSGKASLAKKNNNRATYFFIMAKTSWRKVKKT